MTRPLRGCRSSADVADLQSRVGGMTAATNAVIAKLDQLNHLPVQPRK